MATNGHCILVDTLLGSVLPGQLAQSTAGVRCHGTTDGRRRDRERTTRSTLRKHCEPFADQSHVLSDLVTRILPKSHYRSASKKVLVSIASTSCAEPAEEWGLVVCAGEANDRLRAIPHPTTNPYSYIPLHMFWVVVGLSSSTTEKKVHSIFNRHHVVGRLDIALTLVSYRGRKREKQYQQPRDAARNNMTPPLLAWPMMITISAHASLNIFESPLECAHSNTLWSHFFINAFVAG